MPVFTLCWPWARCCSICGWDSQALSCCGVWEPRVPAESRARRLSRPADTKQHPAGAALVTKVIRRNAFSRTLAWAMWVITVAQVAFGFGLGALNRLDLLGFFAQYVVAMALGALAFASVGVLVVARQRNNAIGWLFCAIGTGLATGWMTEYAHLGLVTDPGAVPGAD